MLDIRLRGLPCILMGSAHPPGALNANRGRQLPLGIEMPEFLASAPLWTSAAIWVPMRPESSRTNLTVVK